MWRIVFLVAVVWLVVACIGGVLLGMALREMGE